MEQTSILLAVGRVSSIICDGGCDGGQGTGTGRNAQHRELRKLTEQAEITTLTHVSSRRLANFQQVRSQHCQNGIYGHHILWAQHMRCCRRRPFSFPIAQPRQPWSSSLPLCTCALVEYCVHKFCPLSTREGPDMQSGSPCFLLFPGICPNAACALPRQVLSCMGCRS